MQVNVLIDSDPQDFQKSLEAVKPNFLYLQGYQHGGSKEIGPLVWKNVEISDPEALCSLLGSKLPNTVYLGIPEGEEFADALQSKVKQMKARHKLREAVDSLFSQGQASAASYTRLVLECFRSNDVDQAKRLQSHMDLHWFQPTDTFIHNRLLHLYAKAGKMVDAQNLFNIMPVRDIFSWNAMLSLFAKSRFTEELWATFNEMPFHDSVSYNTIIAGLTDNGFPRRGHAVFSSMIANGFEPNERTFVSVLHACSLLRDLSHGKQIHGRMVVTAKLGVNPFVWNALIDMYAKCGEIEYATWVFERMPDKNVVTWNSIISAYLENGKPEKCMDLFQKMQLSSLKPDQVTLSNILTALLQTKHIDDASKIFCEIKDKDKVCWTTMIAGLSQNGREEEALMLFRQMLAENVQQDSFTISSVISSCAKLASLYLGQVMHSKAIHMRVDNNQLVSSALIDMYGKCGVIADARFVFDMMQSRNVFCWNAMIRGYAQNGQDHEALTLYEKMVEENLKPDSVTFVAVLSACYHANLIEEGERHFESMGSKYGISPTFDHYACMIQLLGRSKKVEGAFHLVEQMPYQPNCLIWSSLLSICSMNGDVTRGEIAARKLFDMDPLNAGPYIMLSNIYAAQSRWEDVASVRSLMKSRNVKKFAAYSWIEYDNEVHKFVSGDRTHPLTDQIYEELDDLVRKVEEAGFKTDTTSVLHDVGQDEKRASVCYHSEKLALAYALLKMPSGVPIRILKNIRVCIDCHKFMKYASTVIGCAIILRDSTRYHHFVGGQCSCKDSW